MMIEKLENDMQETIPEQNATSPLHQDLDRTRSILQKMKDIRENKSKKDEPEQELPVTPYTPYSPFFDINSDIVSVEQCPLDHSSQQQLQEGSIFKELTEHMTQTEIKLEIANTYLNSFEHMSEHNSKTLSKIESEVSYIKDKQNSVSTDYDFRLKSMNAKIIEAGSTIKRKNDDLEDLRFKIQDIKDILDE